MLARDAGLLPGALAIPNEHCSGAAHRENVTIAPPNIMQRLLRGGCEGPATTAVASKELLARQRQDSAVAIAHDFPKVRDNGGGLQWLSGEAFSIVMQNHTIRAHEPKVGLGDTPNVTQIEWPITWICSAPEPFAIALRIG
jgi:hypothetical protein